MADIDFTHSNRQITYEPSSAAEEALTRAMPSGTAGVGPVNFTWAHLDPDARRLMWPDA